MLAEDGEDAASVAAPGGGDTAEADDEGAKAQTKDEQPAEEAAAAPESPTPHKIETGARKMYDAASHDAEVADHEIPAGTEMVKMTGRDAMGESRAEEMRGEARVMLKGEEAGRVQSGKKDKQGVLDGWR